MVPARTVRVPVFAEGDAADAAKAAGAEFVGYEDLIAKVQGGFLDFDVAIATPGAMAEVRKLGKQLGPRGLMPNPKTGTVTDDTAGAVKAVKAGRVEFKLDKNGNIAVPVGKVGFEPNALAENAQAVIDAVVRARPAARQGPLRREHHARCDHVARRSRWTSPSTSNPPPNPRRHATMKAEKTIHDRRPSRSR